MLALGQEVSHTIDTGFTGFLATCHRLGFLLRGTGEGSKWVRKAREPRNGRDVKLIHAKVLRQAAVHQIVQKIVLAVITRKPHKD
jgi:hypothetical protein